MSSTHINRLGARIAVARRAAGLSARQVAQDIGINHSNLVRLEQGAVAQPQPAVLDGLARVLHIESADLYALAGYTKPAELPSFTPYLRSKFVDLPPEAREEVERSFERIAKKYGYDANGPRSGEDEH